MEINITSTWNEPNNCFQDRFDNYHVVASPKGEAISSLNVIPLLSNFSRQTGDCFVAAPRNDIMNTGNHNE